jgi:hypothetical protein
VGTTPGRIPFESVTSTDSEDCADAADAAVTAPGLAHPAKTTAISSNGANAVVIVRRLMVARL